MVSQIPGQQEYFPWLPGTCGTVHQQESSLCEDVHTIRKMRKYHTWNTTYVSPTILVQTEKRNAAGCGLRTEEARVPRVQNSRERRRVQWAMPGGLKIEALKAAQAPSISHAARRAGETQWSYETKEKGPRFGEKIPPKYQRVSNIKSKFTNEATMFGNIMNTLYEYY